MGEQWLALQVERTLSEWQASESHQQLLRDDPEFARWLREQYVPLVGGWQY